MHEIETKILGVARDEIAQKMQALGATKVLDTRLVVDWFRPKGTTEGEDPWFLRIRTTSDGKSEVTWKGKSDILGTARKHREINVATGDPQKLADLFEGIGLEKYAHQEKDRISWTYKGWRFDLDQYPGTSWYLEIEGKSEVHIQEAIALLQLQKHKTSSEGERVLIQKEYGLNWYSMYF